MEKTEFEQKIIQKYQGYTAQELFSLFLYETKKNSFKFEDIEKELKSIKKQLQFNGEKLTELQNMIRDRT